MVYGKKGFDRLVYVCYNVFIEFVIWLFSNVLGKSDLVFVLFIVIDFIDVGVRINIGFVV